MWGVGVGVGGWVGGWVKLHASKAGSHMLSSDSSVRAIATQVTLRESQLQRVSFRPHQVVVGVMEEDP